MIACLDGIGSEGGAGASRGSGSASGGKRGSGKAARPPRPPRPPRSAGRANGTKESKGRGNSAKSTVADTASWPAFLEVAGAPRLADHHPAMDASAMQAHFDAKRRAREARIAELVAEAERNGRPSERIIAAIMHDSEHAPHSTNRRQLAEIGVACPPPGAVELGATETHEALWRVIYGLAFLGIFLSSTDHLDDRSLLRILASRILDESIRDVPPSADMSEFIDLGPCRPAHACLDHEGTPAPAPAGMEGDPDDLEGPYEQAEEVEDDDDGILCGEEDPKKPRRRARHRSEVVDRDRLLPRPRRPTEGEAP